MTKSKAKPGSLPSVTVKIHEGQPSPSQKAAWRKFWAKLISEAIKSEGPEAVLPIPSNPTERSFDDRLPREE